MGTRLEQLEALRRRITLEIEMECRRVAQLGAVPPRMPDLVQAWLRVLGVTAYDVKVWGVEHGLLTSVRRGRVSVEVVRAFAEAHQ